MASQSVKRLRSYQDKVLSSDNSDLNELEASSTGLKRQKTSTSNKDRNLRIARSQIDSEGCHPNITLRDEPSRRPTISRSRSRSQRSSLLSSSRSSKASEIGSLASATSDPLLSSKYGSPSPGTQYIWGQVARRAKWVPSPGHESILANAIPTIQAILVTNYFEDGSTVWADTQQKGHLSQLIQSTWSRLASERLLDKYEVAESPDPHEARKMYDTIGEIRSHMMEKARDTVRSHYTFGSDHGGYVEELLKGNTAFLSVKIDDPMLPKLFLSDVMSKTIAQLFFSNDRGSLGTNQLTKHMFNPLTSDLIILVATMIRHAISEYRHSPRRVIKFEGQVIDKPYKAIRKLWFSGCAERQEMVKNALRNIVIQISGTKEELADAEVVNYAFKDSLSDLDDLDCTADRGGREALVSGLASTQKDDVAMQDTPAGVRNLMSKGGTDTAQRGATAEEAEKRDGLGKGMDDMTLPILPVTDEIYVTDRDDEMSQNSIDIDLISESEIAGDEYLAEVEGMVQRHKLKLGMKYSSWMEKLGTKATNKGGRAVWYQRKRNERECIVDDREGYKKFIAFARRHGEVRLRLHADDEYNSS